MTLQEAMQAAIRSVATHGDTDIFPFPLECRLFADRPHECVRILEHIHGRFDECLATYPPEVLVTLSQVGYTGFRWATQIEPFWNAYYLACVLSVANQIEAVRLPEDESIVFSYRLQWQHEQGKIFKDSTWSDYKKHSIGQAQVFPVIVMTDIADFYPRVYHHRIENALKRLNSPGDMPSRIMKLLRAFSRLDVSYGLPIGGPASRILAELALAGVDRHLRTRHIPFCRYADDYTMFCKDKADAYRSLVFLSEQLFNEGLVLQKKKTRILSSQEFLETSKPYLPPDPGQSPTPENKLLNIHVRFDPYSPTAVEDYETIKTALGEVDVVAILAREVAKVAVDPAVSRQAISAVRALPVEAQSGALRTLLEPDNLEVLAPVFVSILRLLRAIYSDLGERDQKFVDTSLMGLHRSQSPLLSLELNVAYSIQVLGQKHSQEKEELLVELFETHKSALVRRAVILALARWGCHYWLSGVRSRYGSLTSMEKRAFIIASYALGDEGEHWRRNSHKSWSPMDCAARDWFADRWVRNPEIPL